MSPEPEREPDLPPAIPVDWFDDGLLWMVNAQLFHPQGYALEVDPETGKMHLQGDGRERWAFDESDPATVEKLDARWLAFRGLLRRAQQHNARASASPSP